MGVEIGFSQSRKMFAASQHASRAHSGEKLFHIGDGLLRIGGNRARAQHWLCRFKSQITDRSKIHVEAERPSLSAEHFAVFPEEPLGASARDVMLGWSRRDHLAQPIHRAALQVHTSEDGNV